MNKWLERSIELAQNKNYLDKLQEIYKLPSNKPRELDKDKWDVVIKNYKKRDNIGLIKSLLELDLFPIKHSFVAYFRRDPSSMSRNPKTVFEVSKILYDLGIEGIKISCKEAKETNRQIGPLFKNYLRDADLNIAKYNHSNFLSTNENALYMGSDDGSKRYAAEKLGYRRNKGLDFLAKINGKHIIGEAKFLTDFGGHQNAQLDDAYSTLKASVRNTEKILILDGVLYIANSGKMYQTITQEFKNENIMSAVLIKGYIMEKINEA